MEKNTMIFLIIILLIAVVIGYFFWKDYEEKKIANQYDASGAWAQSAGGMVHSLAGMFGQIFGR